MSLLPPPGGFRTLQQQYKCTFRQKYFLPAQNEAHSSSLLYILTNKPTPWREVLPEKQKGLKLVKKFPTFYGT
jgi:hypothetical protein